MTARQAGDCSVERGRSHESVADVRLEVAADGSFTAVEYSGNKKIPEVAWSGAIGSDLSVRAERKTPAWCRGVKAEVISQFTGTLKSSSAGPLLEVSGSADICPAMKCVFAIEYRVSRKPS